MILPKPNSASHKLWREVQLARVRLAKAKNELVLARAQARLAKRHRKEAKEAARRAKKQARRAKNEVAEAEGILVEAEARLARAPGPVSQTRAVTKPTGKVTAATRSKKVAHSVRLRVVSPAKSKPQRLGKPKQSTPHPAIQGRPVGGKAGDGKKSIPVPRDYDVFNADIAKSISPEAAQPERGSTETTSSATAGQEQIEPRIMKPRSNDPLTPPST